MDADAISNLLYESLADDEALRGNLSDMGYAPLLGWAAARAAQLAPATTEADLDRMAAALRGALRAVVAAATTGAPEDLAGIDPIVVPPELEGLLPTALRAAPQHPDGRARALAAVLVEASR